VIKVTEN